MRRLLISMLTAGLIAGPAIAKTRAVARVETCTNATDRTAFDTEGLKSELMVTALTCNQQDRYNGFMRTYQPSVASQEHELSAYFKRAYGRAASKAYDDYISNLANVQEQDGLKAGSAFCQIFTNMFDEVMSLHDGSELADYAHSQAIVQPVAFTTCSDVPVKALSKPRHRVSKHRSA
jgi:hypothetical protein